MTKKTFTQIKQEIEDNLDASRPARETQALCQDFYDNKQWTKQEEQVLKERHQQPTIDNRIREKVNGQIGYYEKRKVEIRAFPRNKTVDGEAASLVSKAIDAVGDENNMPLLINQTLKSLIITGIECILIDFDSAKKTGISLRFVPFDRIVYSMRSSMSDFSDGDEFSGLIWLTKNGVKEMYPNANMSKLDFSGNDFYSYDKFTEDKPIWYSNQDGQDRFLITENYYLQDGVWYRSVLSGNEFLEKPKKSIFVDDNGNSLCPFIVNSLNVDRENNRYGDVLADIWMQKELNARRSKSLHLLSSRQTKAPQGAIQDVEGLKEELAKPDGHVEIQGEVGDFEIIGTSDFARGHLMLYQDTKEYFNTAFTNGNMAGDTPNSGNMSGHAIHLLQSGSAMSKEYIFQSHNDFLKRVNRYIWYAIKQSWTQEEYVRIVDDYNATQWVGFNVPITLQQHVKKIMEDNSIPQDEKRKTMVAFQAIARRDPAAAQQIVYIENDLSSMYIDITLEVSNASPLMNEVQFQYLMQNRQNLGLSDEEILLFSGFQDKFKIIDTIKKKREEQQQQANQMRQMQLQAAQQAQQVEMAKAQAAIQKDTSTAQLNQQKAVNVAIENQQMASQNVDLERATDVMDLRLKEKQVQQKEIENLTAMLAPLDKTPQVVI